MSLGIRERFERMVCDLERNAAVRVLDAQWRAPATAAELADARAAAGGELPACVEAFYRAMNGFRLEWEIMLEPLRSGDDHDRGFINLLPVTEVFGDWQGIVWFADVPPSRRFEAVRPFDLFVGEACAAFVLHPREIDRVHYLYIGESIESTGYDFEGYLDRLLVSRGAFYWIHTLCKSQQSSPEAAIVRRNLPLLFDDYEPDLFVPRS